VVAFYLHRKCVLVRLLDSSTLIKSNSQLAIEGLAPKAVFMDIVSCCPSLIHHQRLSIILSKNMLHLGD
jgi:hypothetical protein